jgi:hypothetical protein
VPSDVSSLVIATISLKLTESLIKAIDARAPGVPAPGQVARGDDRFEPRQVIHPDPRYLPRQILHPTPRYLPRPVLHPTPRVENRPSPTVEKPAPFNPTPWPFPPVWKVLPALHSHSCTPILKIAAPRIDILNKGTLVDLFI